MKTQKSGESKLQLAKRVFNGLPKLFNPKFKPGLEHGVYSFYIHAKRPKLLWLNNRLIRPIRYCLAPKRFLKCNDLNDILLMKFFKALTHAFDKHSSKKENVTLLCYTSLHNLKKIVCNSFEELLVKIDMNAVE